jgi:ketosteroid isomerase-like protein
MPAIAADANLEQDVKKVGSAYIDAFNKQDAAGVAAFFASGGMLVTRGGQRTDIEQAITVDQVWRLGTDAALAANTYHLTGKNQSGAPMVNAGLWTAVDVRESGNWRIRMLTAFPRPPPPK